MNHEVQMQPGALPVPACRALAAASTVAPHARPRAPRARWWSLGLGIALLFNAAAPVRASESGWSAEVVWMPQYCRDHANERAGDACTQESGFSLRRLRPLQEVACRGKGLSEADIHNATRVVASARWARDMWRRDGACSGLSPSEYFDLVGRLNHRMGMASAASLARPGRLVRREALERELLRYQENADQASLLLRCDGRALTQVEMCVDDALAPVACVAAKPSTLCRSDVELRTQK